MILLLGLMALAQSEQSSDLAERVIVRLGVSYDPVLGAGVASQVLGADAALGTRGLLMPTLNTYALARGAMDLAGTPALSLAEDPHGEHPVLPSVYQRGRTLLLHLARTRSWKASRPKARWRICTCARGVSSTSASRR